MFSRCLLVLLLAGMGPGNAYSGTVGYWQFDDGAAGSPATTLASEYNASAFSTVAAGNGTGDAPSFVDDVPGTVIHDGVDGPVLNDDNRSALAFASDGNDNGGYVSIQDLAAHDSLLEPADFTIEAFVKSEGTQADSSILVKSVYGTGISWSMGTYWRPAALSLRVDSFNPFSANRLEINNNLTDGVWHHIALTYDSATQTFSLYQDYTLLGTLDQLVPTYDDAPILLGNLINGSAYSGLIDEVRFSNAALEPDQFLVAVTPVYSKHYLGDDGLSVIDAVSSVGPPRLGSDFFGRGIFIGGTAYARGLGVHAHQEVSIMLNGEYAFFVATLGLSDGAGSVSFQLKGDGSLLYTSAVLSEGDTVDIRVDVSGVTKLALVTTDGGDGSSEDSACWANAHLLKLYTDSVLPSWRPVEIGTEGNQYNGYWEFLPLAHRLDPTEKLPLVIFHHGFGEGGDGLLAGPGEGTDNKLDDVLVTAIPQFLNNPGHWLYTYLNTQKVIVLCPQTKAGTWWNAVSVSRFVEFAKASYPVDTNRIYLTGLSAGSSGIADYINQFAQSTELAAVLLSAVRGQLDTTNGSMRGRYIPLWALTAIGDASITAERSVNRIAGRLLNSADTHVRGNYPGASTTRTASFNLQTGWTWEDGVVPEGTGNHPKFTLYPGDDHGTWNTTYGNISVWKWLLEQVKPEVVITSPNDGISINVSQPLALHAIALDKDGAALNDAAFSWSSDKDGVIGTAPNVTVSALSLGTHVITCAAIDDDLRLGVADITVEVLPDETPSTPYLLWAQLAGLDALNRDEQLDPDFDGLSNFWEYALARDPLLADAYEGMAGELIRVNEDGFVSLVMPRPHGANDLIYSIKVSTDMIEWDTVGVSFDSGHFGSGLVETIDHGDFLGLRFRDIQALNSSSPTRFMRVEVSR